MVHYFHIVRAVQGLAGLGSTAQQAKLAKLARQLSLYPLIFVVSWAFITVVRVSQGGSSARGSSEVPSRP